MDATHPTSEKPLGLLVKGSRNTPSQQPQVYLNTVKISTTHYLPSPILALKTRIPLKSPERPKKPSYKKAGP